MKRLTEHGFIDDVRYAERMARKLVEVKKYGYRRSKREIMQKGIDQFTAEDALTPYSEAYYDNIMELLRTKHFRYLIDREDRKSIEKVKSALVRYGYDFTEINCAVKEYFENTWAQQHTLTFQGANDRGSYFLSTSYVTCGC